MIKLGIKQKISLLIILSLLIAVITLASISIYKVKQKAEADLLSLRQEETKKVKDNLESYMNLAYQSVEHGYNNIADKEYVQKLYGHRLKNIIDLAEASLQRRAEQVKRGELSLAEAQRLAITEIENMRYDEGTGYIFINDATLPYPNMIMHPTLPATNGKVLDDPKYNCAMGKNQNLFQAMAEVCLAQGHGFVDYLWPKPTANGLIPDVKKLTYVSYFQEWGWVLGTGIYLDDVKQDVVDNILEDLADLRYGEDGYFWVNDATLPYPTMIMHPTVPATNGKVLDDASYNSTKDTQQNFFQLMVEKAKAEGKGFVEYLWPKPGHQQHEPKLSYVRLFEPLGWVIGTGVYTDNIETLIAEKQRELEAQINELIFLILSVSILLVVAGSAAALYMAHNMTTAIYLVKGRLQDLALGRSIQKVAVTHQDEIGAMIHSLNHLVEGIGAYTQFAKEIGKGNLDVEFKALSEEDTLGNSLLQMRSDLKQVASAEEIRKWFNEGIAQVGETLRKHNHDLEALCLQVNSQLVRYLQANQASLYILQEPAGKPPYLELKACYAYGRRKFLEQQINLGEGLAGQVVLEKAHIYLTKIPNGYTTIHSGLGEATPAALLIMPLINNEQVMGVVELASFNTFAEHEIAFLQKISENIASSIASVKTNEVTRHLLQETQQMTEAIRAQEEELRQNTEELMATQEEMSRKLTALERENQQLREQVQK